MVCQQESKTNGRSSHACHGPASTDQVVLLSIEYRYIINPVSAQRPTSMAEISKYQRIF